MICASFRISLFIVIEKNCWVYVSLAVFDIEEKIKEHRFFCGQGKVLNRRGRQFIVFLLKHPAFAARRTFPTGNIMRDVFAIDLAQFLYAVDIRLIHLDDARRAAVACRFDASDGIGDNLLALLARRILD